VIAVLADIAEIAGLISQRGWAERNAGNVSVDVTGDGAAGDPQGAPGIAELVAHGTWKRVDMPVAYSALAGRSYLVTATGARLRDVAKRPEEYVVLARMTADGSGYDILLPPGRDPRTLTTSEFPSHLGVHDYLRRNRPAKRAVLHTHPDHLLALTHVGRYCSTETLSRLLWSMHPEMKIVMPDGVGHVPYCLPGSEILAQATVDVLQSHRLVLWEKHGCVAVGGDVFEAFDLIDTAEKSAKIFLMLRAAGFEADGLTAEQLDELRPLPLL
jgi:rhamnulose-1-phosphate aldolase